MPILINILFEKHLDNEHVFEYASENADCNMNSQLKRFVWKIDCLQSFMKKVESSTFFMKKVESSRHHYDEK